MREFEDQGFTVIRDVVSAAECDRFLEEAVVPALEDQGLKLGDEGTWPPGVAGMRVRGVDGSDHPISGRDKRWPAFFASTKLRAALDGLHGGEEGTRWRWNAGAVDGVGWIHLRFPVHDGPWEAPTEGWHLDETTQSLQADVSVVLLPVVTPLRGGAGGTAVLRGSHLEIARAMRLAGSQGAVDWDRLQALIEGYLKPAMLRRDPAAISEARAEPGDAIVLHPLVYHAASDALRGAPPRVTFNLSVHHAGGLPLPSDPLHSPSPLERTLLAGITTSTQSPRLCSADLHYGEPFFLRFAEHRGLLGFPGDDGVARVTGDRHFVPATRDHAETCAVCFYPPHASPHAVGDIVHFGHHVLLKRFFFDRCLHVDPQQQKKVIHRGGGSSPPDDDAADVDADGPRVKAQFPHVAPHLDLQRLEVHGIATLPVQHGDTFALRSHASKVCLAADPADDGCAPHVAVTMDHPARPWHQLTLVNFLRP